MNRLKKEDLICLVMGGHWPPYRYWNEYTEKGYGYGTGGHIDKWTWKQSGLEKLPEKELLDMYFELKEIWLREVGV